MKRAYIYNMSPEILTHVQFLLMFGNIEHLWGVPQKWIRTKVLNRGSKRSALWFIFHGVSISRAKTGKDPCRNGDLICFNMLYGDEHGSNHRIHRPHGPGRCINFTISTRMFLTWNHSNPQPDGYQNLAPGDLRRSTRERLLYQVIEQWWIVEPNIIYSMPVVI